MIRRIITALFFLCGGCLAYVVMALVLALGQSQAGMSAGPVSGSGMGDFLEKAIFILVCSYFLASALSTLLAKNRPTLLLLAALSHLILLLAFAALCVGGVGKSKDLGDFLGGVAVILGIGAVSFAPWLGAWAFTIAKAEQPSNPAA